MARTVYFHGGKAGLVRGDMLIPSAPHIVDGCPICVARANGRAVTVGEYRVWLKGLGVRGEPILRQLADAPDSEVIDAPTGTPGVYITTDFEYARFYAARSEGDLYQVAPVGPIEKSDEDNFESFVVQSARIVKVLERRVRLTRRDRRHLSRRWEMADRRVRRG